MRAVFERLCPGSGDRLACTMGLVGGYTTAGYAHLTDAHLVETAEKVGSLIARAMEP